MYTPRAFREDEVARVHDLVDAYPFGMLVVPHAGGVEVTHVPFVLDRDAGPAGRLRCHVARANPVAGLLADGGPVVAVFRGPHGYVSPRWYEAPHEQVPTWNYAVAHAHGRAARTSRDGLLALLADLARIHEAGAPAPWSPGVLDPGLRDGMLDEIVGLEVAVERWDGKSKLSQNRSDEDRRRVAAALRERGTEDDLAMVRRMEREPPGRR